jgi:hypothetical protein
VGDRFEGVHHPGSPDRGVDACVVAVQETADGKVDLPVVFGQQPQPLVFYLQNHGAKDALSIDIFNNIPKFHCLRIATDAIKVNETKKASSPCILVARLGSMCYSNKHSGLDDRAVTLCLR